ncbi:fumarylacetoacetate hydrolase family protein [Burkholderiales bacterium]|jgi:ureidoglycolate lyase|nr:fumarylacetoacetate hydrolase family protein [Betaproteobacteria bacterium]MBT7998567.1 fumarylacetoacetate hydrolase family protein [Betaproteobacteria bacterium]MDC1433146.1 fumarylacetoacetate hydrolase family protein [Burkholderiales bacterium]MDG2202458.1 fumarylacetoacetate hydrolase family protein [Burkholderiales bacterium]|tara:strand:- start:547 stop:1395 length:849 start_codon:yes stop_codon:yes gene_type:complete
MKLVRYGEIGAEKPGLIDSNGNVRDLSTVVSEINGDALSESSLTKLNDIEIDSLNVVPGNPRLGLPISGTPKLICIGLNYSDHAKESNMPIPTEPVVFMKAISALNGPSDDVILPDNSVKGDWEVELAVVIGSTAKKVNESEALAHVAGYTICNDVSEREWQLEHGNQWSKGKSFDTFAPVGPWLVTKDEINDPQNLAMWLDLNGKRMQTGNTNTMIFGVEKLISYLSHFVTLQPGDIISTGTPPGVGMGVKPEPVFLKIGDEMRLGIDGLGEQKQNVIAGK